MLHAGSDLSRRRSDIYVHDEHGEPAGELAAPARRDGLHCLVRRLHGHRVRAVIESMNCALRARHAAAPRDSDQAVSASSLRAWFSISRIRSDAMFNSATTSCRVRGVSPVSPNRISMTSRSSGGSAASARFRFSRSINRDRSPSDARGEAARGARSACASGSRRAQEQRSRVETQSDPRARSSAARRWPADYCSCHRGSCLTPLVSRIKQAVHDIYIPTNQRTLRASGRSAARREPQAEVVHDRLEPAALQRTVDRAAGHADGRSQWAVTARGVGPRCAACPAGSAWEDGRVTTTRWPGHRG